MKISRKSTGYCDSTNGMITPFVLVMASIFIIFGTALINWSITAHKNAVTKIKKVQSLQIAEAGVNYYKWHLAHNYDDYKDGNNWCCDNDPDLTIADCGNVCGPYEHEYRDYNDNVAGNFSLKIIPPEVGSTIFNVESTGSAAGGATVVEEKITFLVGKRSLAEYSFLTHSPIWIGENEGASGPLHSNGGIRFDGVSNSEVTSAVSTYECAGTGHDCSGTKPGIWGEGGPSSYWKFPVPEIDFDLFTVDMAEIRDNAGYYVGPDLVCSGYSATHGICFEDSGAEGYLVKFLSNGTVDISIVNTLRPKIWYYNTEIGTWKKEAEEIQTKTLLGNYNMPSNGLIFLGDDVWAEGTVNGKVTLAAAKFPESSNDYARIRINNNINYTARDGNDNLGLMAQGDIMVPRYASSNLIIDATLLSQNGHVYYRYYSSHSIKNSIEVYGGIITNLFWTWTWVDGSGVTVDGYNNTNTVYNNNLTFAPPPFFPTAEKIEILSWREE